MVELGVFAEFVGPEFEHGGLLEAEAYGEAADFLPNEAGDAVEDVFGGGFGECVLQPGGDEHGLLGFVEDGDVGGEVIVTDGPASCEMGAECWYRNVGIIGEFGLGPIVHLQCSGEDFGSSWCCFHMRNVLIFSNSAN